MGTTPLTTLLAKLANKRTPGPSPASTPGLLMYVMVDGVAADYRQGGRDRPTHRRGPLKTHLRTQGGLLPATLLKNRANTLIPVDSHGHAPEGWHKVLSEELKSLP